VGEEWEFRWVMGLHAALSGRKGGMEQVRRELMQFYAREAEEGEETRTLHAALFHLHHFLLVAPGDGMLAVSALLRELEAKRHGLPLVWYQMRARVTVGEEERERFVGWSPEGVRLWAVMRSGGEEWHEQRLTAETERLRRAVRLRAETGRPVDGDPLFMRSLTGWLERVAMTEPGRFEEALQRVAVLPRRPGLPEDGSGFAADEVEGWYSLRDAVVAARYRWELSRGGVERLAVAMGNETLEDRIGRRYWEAVLGLERGDRREAERWIASVRERETARYHPEGMVSWNERVAVSALQKLMGREDAGEIIHAGHGVEGIERWWTKTRWALSMNGLQTRGMGLENPFPEIAAAEWVALDADGRVRDAAEFHGRAQVLVFYLGEGCVEFVEQLRAFQPHRELFSEMAVELVAFGLDPYERLPVAEERIADGGEGSSFLLLADPEGQVFDRFGVRHAVGGEPLHGVFVVDMEGLVLWWALGEHPFAAIDFLAEETERLLRERQRTRSPIRQPVGGERPRRQIPAGR